MNAMDIKELTRNWIQYLKNNRIAALKSDPTGKLKYNRQVTTADVSDFLDGRNGLTIEQINNAIQSVISPNQQPVQQANQQPARGGKQPGVLSQTPGAVRRRQQRQAAKTPTQPTQQVNEEIRDQQSQPVSEKQVEDIFAALTTPAPETPETPPTPDETAQKANEEFKKIKRIIRDVMTDSQRKSLWRLLNET
jgi:hypothetical protein